MPENEGVALVPVGERGIGALDPGHDASIEYRNWHAISSALTAAAENLTERSLGDLAAALQSIEQYFPDLNAEIGMANATLDLAPVSDLKKFGAMILARFFPAFNSIIRRSELREGAEAKLKTLERVRDQLRELRIALADKIDKAVELSLKDTDLPAYERCVALREWGAETKGQIVRLKALMEEKNFRTFQTDNRPMGLFQLLTDSESNLSAILNFYQEVTGTPVTTASKLSPAELTSKLTGLQMKLEGKMASYIRLREEILHAPKLKLLAEAGASYPA